MGSGIDAKAPEGWKAPLQIPAVELVDLSSEGEGTVEQSNHETTRDAWESKSSESDVNEDGGEDDERAGDGDGDGDDDEDDSWSIYEELINVEESEGEPSGDPGAESFTLEESLALRKRLRLIGGERFFDETVGNGSIKAKKLITAFGIRPPAFLEGCPDVLYCKLLELGIARELSKRQKLPQYNTIDDAVSLLKNAHNIIVLTGAGISTSLGIPDFRSKETGLYAQLAHLGLSDPQEVFDISLFREDPSIFYSVAKDILPSSDRFSPTHAFIRLLQDKSKLLTNFTQNIDNLEGAAGIKPDKLIQCHGSFATATCIECKHHVPGSAIYKDLHAGKISRCDACLKRIRNEITTTTTTSSLSINPSNGGGTKRKRSADFSSSSSSSSFSCSTHTAPAKKKQKKKKRKKQSNSKKQQDYSSSSSSSSDEDEDSNIATAGVMKPDITFFGESLPDTFHTRLLEHDRDRVDLVIVIGTSLQVAPVSEVVGVLPRHVPQIYISREACKHVEFDVDLLGDCDGVVVELCRRAGWELRHEMVEEGQEVEAELVEGYGSRYRIRKVEGGKSGGEGVKEAK